MYKRFHVPVLSPARVLPLASLICFALWLRLSGNDILAARQLADTAEAWQWGARETSAAFIAASCFAMVTGVVMLLYRLREKILLRWFLAGLAVFLLACATRQLLTIREIWSWQPAAAHMVEGVMAIGAIVTALLVTPAIPRINAMLRESSAAAEKTRDLQEILDALRRETVAERKRAEQNLRATHDHELKDAHTRYQMLAEMAPVGIFHSSGTGQNIYVNQTWCKITGLSQEEARQEGWARGVHPEDRARIIVEWNAAITNGAAFQAEFRFLRPDGLTAWVLAQARPQRDAEGGIGGFVGTITDITDRKHAELMQLRLAAIVSSSDDAIIGLTLGGIITSWNNGAERIFGYGGEEALGRHVSMLSSPERAKEGREIIEQIRVGERVQHFETGRVRKDGRRIDVALTVSPIRNHAGQIVGISKIAQDISERRQTELAMDASRHALESANQQLAEKNDRLSKLYQTAQRFVDDVSHEFRTPLSVIKGYSEILRDGIAGGLNTEQTEFTQLIVDRTRDLTQMVDDLLDASKLRAGSLRVDRKMCDPASIFKAVRPMLEARAAGNGIKIIEDISPALPPVFADAEKAARVLVNLAVNAIKFSAPESSVTLWAKPGPGDDVEIGVTDSGPGISPEDLAVIFQRFQQLQAVPSNIKGFGLGLNIAKELVALNLGKMKVVSALGNGSTFSFTLPVNDPDAILQRFLENLESLDLRDGHLAMLRVAPDPAGTAPEELRRFVAAMIRPADIILPSPDGDSLILFGHATKPQRWLEELERAGGSIQRYSPTQKLCGFKAEMIGTWPYPAGREAALANCLAEFAGEVAYA